MVHTTNLEKLINFEEDLKIASSILRALSHPLRFKILNFINENSPVNVYSIYKSLSLDQSITSQQLRILREAGVVHTQRKGKEIFYSLHLNKLKKIIEVLSYFTVSQTDK